jgi:hypothetical protein
MNAHRAAARVSLIVALVWLCASLAAPVAAQPRVAVATDQLRNARTLSSEELRERAADNRWTAVELTRNAGRIAIQTADAPVPVAASAELVDVVQALPLNAKLRFNQATSAVEIEQLTLRPTDRWQAQSAAVRAFYPEVTRAHEALAAAALPVLADEPSEAQVEAFVQQALETEQAVLDAYAALDPSLRIEGRALVDQFLELRATNKRNKAHYGRDDRHPPAAYDRIYRNSRSALALIGVGMSESFCSGVLVGNALALTNQHCIKGLISTMRVQFNYEIDLAGNPLQRRTFPVASVLVQGKDLNPKLDFALLEIGADAQGTLPGAEFPPQCLSTTPLERDAPVYLVGHPLGQPRTVHDNAFVYFPFRVTPEQRTELEMLVRAEFPDAVAEQDQLDAFRASYRSANAQGQAVFEHYSTQFGGQPTIGADSDTYEGNSGSPAFSRRTHNVIGLLFAGEADIDEPWNPGWRSHEAIIPIEVVISQLDVVKPGWRDVGSGVCVGD